MNKQKKVVIIDYQMSNLFNVKHACDFIGLHAVISSAKKDLMDADAAVLPGVGAFGDAMQNLTRLDLISPIKNFIESGRPFLGVCLGMQLLLSESEEFGKHQGLNIIPGQVLKFPSSNKVDKPIKVPQIGWNKIYPKDREWKDSLLDNIGRDEYMYFIHSYCVYPKDKRCILSVTDYEGIEYCSALEFGNVMATQFHPEKSGAKGLLIYQNFAQSITT